MKLFRSLLENYRLKNGLILIAVLVFGAVLAVALVSPFFKNSELKKRMAADTVYLESYTALYDHPALSPLVRDIAWKESLLLLSEKDSIQLAINLADSVLCLYLKGVLLHEVPITRFRIDPYLKSRPEKTYVWLFSKPLAVKDQSATIVREPVVVREAPDDPLEAELNAWEPDTLIQNPAFFQLRLDHGIDLVIEQDENSQIRDKWVRFNYFNKLRCKRIQQFYAYSPSISVRIPVKDVRAIYRALPDEAEVCIRYNSNKNRP
jgi:hypothetical protein